MLGWMVCGVLTAALIMVSIQYIGLRRSMNEIAAQFGERLEDDTNNVIALTYGNASARRFAAAINRQLVQLRRQRLNYLTGDRELKEAVTNISHDLRTPLTAIAGYLELLEEVEMSDTARQYLTRIAGRTEAMKSLTEELFRYSVIVSSESYARTETAVNKVLEESLLACMGAFAAKGITPDITLPDAAVYRKLDEAALGRIFANILSNALKYSDGDLAVTMSGGGVISFTNTAKALTPVTVERLFDRFYTVESARKSTGLGLSIAKLLTERMGGTIGAHYADGRLTITVSFPEMD